MKKTIGRPKRALTAKERRDLQSKGLSSTISTRRQLDRVIIDSGPIPDSLVPSINAMVRGCRSKHPSKIGVKDANVTAKKIMGTAMETVLHRVVKELTDKEVYSPSDALSPWVLHSEGDCKQHVDCEDKGVFTLLICASCDEPYKMRISRNTMYTTSQFREVTMTSMSFVVFPSVVLHECSGKNKRTIINSLIK